ncbi:MAG: hypothetical protein K2J90_03730 [Lachnospiraceae bacterium]|nr:hypothetical protein [Lachnospiraceae bacterium]
MKYIYINIKNFVRREPAIFLLVLLSIISSTIIIHFFFGLYHHLEQKQLEEQYGSKSVELAFSGTESVTKEEVMSMLMEMEPDLLERCYLSMGVLMPGERREDPVMNSLLTTYTDFAVIGENVTVAPVEKMWQENNMLLDGDYFTKEQVEQGELVCLILREDLEFPIPEQAAAVEQYKRNENGKIVLNGKEYQCIGHIDGLSASPYVPVTTLHGQSEVVSLSFCFDDYVNRNDYKSIEQGVSACFGDQVELSGFEMPDRDSTRFYYTLTLLCVLMMGMSGVVLAMLYEYILLQRKKQLIIYRLCGMTLNRARVMYFAECLVISGMSYFVALLVFHFIMFPLISRAFTYISASYTPKTYGILGFLYIAVTSVLLYKLVCRKLDGNVMQGMEEG